MKKSKYPWEFDQELIIAQQNVKAAKEQMFSEEKRDELCAETIKKWMNAVDRVTEIMIRKGYYEMIAKL